MAKKQTAKSLPVAKQSHQEQQSCSSCKFLRDVKQDAGYCRRFPPVQYKTQSYYAFPKVYLQMWCGEWQTP